MTLAGIFSEIVILAVLFYCSLKVKEFDLKKETFSYLGSIKITSKIFNTGLLIYLILRSVFIFKVIDYFHLWNNLFIIFNYVIALISVFFVTVFTVREHKLIHFIASRLAVITSILFLITLSIGLMNKNYYLGIFNFIISSLLLIIGVVFVLRKKTNAVFQIYFFIPIIIWDWIMTLKLFNIV